MLLHEYVYEYVYEYVGEFFGEKSIHLLVKAK